MYSLDPNERYKSYWAIPVPQEIATAIHAHFSDLDWPNISPPDAYHITLLHLGELTGQDCMNGYHAAEKISQSPFDIGCGNVDAFYHLDIPRVIFTHITQGAESLERLNEKLLDSLPFEYAPEYPDPYFPHLTLVPKATGIPYEDPVDLFQQRLAEQEFHFTANEMVYFAKKHGEAYRKRGAVSFKAT